jgi:23S rRNA A2030 N6-methylase RlmJ
MGVSGGEIGGRLAGNRGLSLILVNPPWTLAAALKEMLPWLAETLAVEKVGAGGTVETNVS